MRTHNVNLLAACLTLLGLIWFPALAAPADAPTLASCSLRFGYLMSDHWLTLDLAHQIERGLFYQPSGRVQELRGQFDKLQASLTTTERMLEDARALYKTLYATNSADGFAQLARLLDQIASAESVNERTAADLLQKLGEQSGSEHFQALPITNKKLAPCWDPQQLIERNYRPRRILFGSTGKVGDDRTLPLKFDFGSGIFGFYIPMAASNQLAVADNLRNRTDPVYGWMKTNHSGYHYWAGVYNNQNTYLAPWFTRQHTNDDDMWMKLANGKVLKDGDWGQANIWNASVQDYLRNYCETQARTFRQDPFLVCYDYTGEPHPWGGQPPGQPQYSGYNDSAIKAFQVYLRAKFGRISKLNKAWSANYASFDSIQPPPDPYVSPPERATPLTYEFERFRCDSHAQVWKLVYDAYRRCDPAKPIEANAGMFMSGWPVEGLDAYQLQKKGVADWIDMHMNNFWPNLAEQIYLYSLCRLTGKVPVQFEYIWTFPRTGPVDDASESDFRATCQASVWRNLAWGKKILVFFDFYYDWPAYHNAFLDRDLGYSILRPSACVVPVTKRKALRFNDLLMQTEVATPPIIVLEPTASILNSPQLHPNQSFSFHSGVAGKHVHELLFPKNYPFLYLPEAAVLDGYDLKQHRVIILPQAPYLPRHLTEQLLKWIRQGGTLISVGVPGIWDPYGRDDLRLVSEVFGPSSVLDDQRGKWKWRWEIARTNSNLLHQIRNADGNLLAAFAAQGKGRVLISTGPFSSPDLQQLFYQALDAAIGMRSADCAHNSFELVLREDTHGRRYLFVLNPHTREIHEDEITLAGRFPRSVDLGIGSGVPLPTLVEQTRTQFRLRLHPGEGTVVSLSP